MSIDLPLRAALLPLPQIFISPAGPGRSIVLTGTLDVRADGKTDANAPRASGPRSPLAALVSALGRLMSRCPRARNYRPPGGVVAAFVVAACQGYVGVALSGLLPPSIGQRTCHV
jgi:hypothetical protein